MKKRKFSSKHVLNSFKQEILSKSSVSTKYFFGAYLLRERIIGQRIKLDVLFVFTEEEKTLEFMEETCFAIYNWAIEQKEEFLIPFYREDRDFSIILRPHFMSSDEFSELPPTVRDALESRKLA